MFLTSAHPRIKTRLDNGVFRNCKGQSDFNQDGIETNIYKKYQDRNKTDNETDLNLAET